MGTYHPDQIRPHEWDGLRRLGIVPIPFHSAAPFIPASLRNSKQVSDDGFIVPGQHGAEIAEAEL